MTTLFDVSGIRARIFTLPNRPPFLIAADLAEVYGTATKRIGEQVKRNPDRFPEDFCFYLTEAEEDQMWSHFATTSARKRDDVRPLVFTHAGALMLSAVLKTPTAAHVSVIVHRAFAAMEKAALDEAKFLLVKLRTEETRRRPIRMQVVAGLMAGMTFESIWKMGTASRPKLAMAALECLALGLIDRLPEGTPQALPDLFGEG
ncbi:MAG: ORF6N domain-containing protein [Tabrizicola sp.]